MDNRIVRLSPPFLHLTSQGREMLESELVQFGKNNQIRIIRVEGSRCTTYDSLMQEFANAFRFPDYFGLNWDALDECINDLDWIPAQSYIVCVYDSDKLLSKNQIEIPVFFEIINDAIYNWTHGRSTDDFPDSPTPFHIIFQSQAEQIEDISSRLEKNGITEFDVYEVTSN